MNKYRVIIKINILLNKTSVMAITSNTQFSTIYSSKRSTLDNSRSSRDKRHKGNQIVPLSNSLTAFIKEELLSFSLSYQENKQNEVHDDLLNSSHHDGRIRTSYRIQRRNALDLVNHPSFALQEEEAAVEEDCDLDKLLINNIMSKLRIKSNKLCCLSYTKEGCAWSSEPSPFRTSRRLWSRPTSYWWLLISCQS